MENTKGKRELNNRYKFVKEQLSLLWKANSSIHKVIDKFEQEESQIRVDLIKLNNPKI